MLKAPDFENWREVHERMRRIEAGPVVLNNEIVEAFYACAVEHQTLLSSIKGVLTCYGKEKICAACANDLKAALELIGEAAE